MSSNKGTTIAVVVVLLLAGGVYYYSSTKKRRGDVDDTKAAAGQGEDEAGVDTAATTKGEEAEADARIDTTTTGAAR